jgi:hypothetical protein
MDRLSAPEQNAIGAYFANLLRKVEQDSGPEFLPRGLDVMGLVRQLALPSAETVEKLSYGDPLFRMPTQSNIPITTDRGYVAEVLGMAPAVPAASRATTRISNEMADQLVRAITGNPQATAPAALEAAGQMAPLARVMSGASRDTIRSSADELAGQLKSLGFQADVTHSGSAAGPSSYVRIYDPETGRFFVNPVRFSGHSKGPFNAGEVIDVQDPSVDIPNIVQEALALRSQGPSDVFKKQQLVDNLIQQGVSPKQAYKQADEMIAKGLLEPDVSYRGSHSAPKRDFGAQLHQLDEIYPDDIYSPKAATFYGHFGQNDPMDRQTIKLAQSLKGKPDADVTIYRAVPKDESIKGINKGDWVTINKNYAKEHGDSALLGEYKILEKKVKAKDIWTNADSIHEYGYDPD